MFTVTLIPFGTSRYEQTKRFRDKILREPLGLALSEKDVEGEGQQFHIAALDDAGDVVGTVVLKPVSVDEIKLRQMAVADNMQGTGLGKKLVTYAETVAKKRGFHVVTMHARISALGFYEKLGYKTEGESFIEVTVPTILMKKRLS